MHTYKRFLLMLVVFIMLIGFVSAFEFDNVATVKSDKTIDIENIFGFGDTIARVTLITPNPNPVIAGKNRRVMIWEIENYGDSIYEDAISSLKIINMLNSKEISKDYHYEYAVYDIRQNPKYEQSCEKITELNSSVHNVCSYEIIGYEDERYIKEWINLGSKTDIPKGNITIALVTDVGMGEQADGIPNLMGVTLSQWAVWNESLETNLISYWRNNETSGSVSADVHTGAYNISWNVEPKWVTGLIDNAVNVSQASIEGNISYNTGTGAQSISFWLKDNAFTNNAVVFGSVTGTSGGWLVYEHTGYIKLVVYDTGLQINGGQPDDLSNLNVWQHYLITFDGVDTWKMYINGTAQTLTDSTGTLGASTQDATFSYENGMAYLTAELDEVSYWNRELGALEAVQLYNDGNGVDYGNLNLVFPITQTINLVNPINDLNTTNSSIVFDSNFQVTNGNFTNATLKIWNSPTNLFATNTTTISGITNATNLSYSGLTIGNYNWSVETCARNFTGYECSIGTNRTLNTLILTEDGLSYRQNTTNGATEYFEINITAFGTYTIDSAILTYNNTVYSGTITNIAGQKYKISRVVNLPLVNSNVNNTFYWNITLSDSSMYRSSNINQSVYVLSIDDCSVNTFLLFNMTMYDEGSQSILDASADNTSIKTSFEIYNSDKSTKLLNYSNSFQYINSAVVCLSSNISSSSNYLLDGLIEYSSNGRFKEFYNLKNYNLTLSTTNNLIKLYDLNDTIGQEFKITYKDSNFVPVSDALINIQRKYVDEGVFKTIEIPITSAEGYAIGHLVPFDVVYNIIIIKNSVVLSTFNNVVADCQNPLLSTCEINLNSFSSSNLPSDFTNYNDISFTMTYNNTIREIKSIFVIPSGVLKTVDLNVTLFDVLGNTTVCSDSLYSSGGQVDCISPLGFGNTTILASLYKDGVKVAQSIISISQKPSDLYGKSIMFIALFAFLILIGIGAMSDSPMTMGIILIVGSIVMVSLNIIYSPSFVGAGATILWFIIAVVLLLVKGGGR